MKTVRIVSLALVATLASALAGCKTASPLAEDEARRQLATIFAGPAATQSVTFVSGAVEERPYAIDQFLYAKHWSTCETQRGALENTPTCSLDDEGATYGHANGWTVAPASSPRCGHCDLWTIPVATAHLDGVRAIDVTDKTHAVVTYAFTVTPNEFGASLGAWTAGHELSWCGADAAAIGGWSLPRTARAAFRKDGAAWALDSAPAAFADVFAVDVTPRRCAGT